MPLNEFPDLDALSESDKLAMNNILSAVKTIKLTLLAIMGILAIGYGIYEGVNKFKLPDNAKAPQIQNSSKPTEPILP